MANNIGLKLGVDGEKDFKKSLTEINQSFKVLGSEMKLVQSQFDKNDDSIKAISSRNTVLNKEIEAQKEKINILKDALNNAATSFGETDRRTQNWQIQLNNAEAALNKMEKEVKSNNDRLEEADKNFEDAEKSVDDLGHEVEDTGKEMDKASSKTSTFGDVLKATLTSQVILNGIKTIGSALKSIGGALVNVGKKAVESYAEYEQLAGGVETLFGKSADTVKKYANNAYKTAGLSANEYMETVTSFSASLLQSLNGDTAKAAKVADMAISDMSDNANKMGTDMSMIQNAYQGFAKQNYTMLDNLKLGYGGTKTEMERLLKDAEKLSGQKYDISNLNDVYEAIHVVQTEMGITGTTAKEASTTLEGSVNSMKAAWSNLVTGIADDNADFKTLATNMSDSIITVLDNFLPRVKIIIEGIGEMLPQLATTILPEILKIITDTLPGILSALASSLTQLGELIIETLPTIIEQIGSALLEQLPTILNILLNLIMVLFESLLEMLPDIVETLMEAFTELIIAIGERLPEFIPMIIEAVLGIINAIIDNIDVFIDALMQFISGLVEGLLNALPLLIEGVIKLVTKLVEKLPDILITIINTVVDMIPLIISSVLGCLPQLIKGAIDLVIALVTHLPEIILALINALPNIIESVIDGLMDALPQLIEGCIMLVVELVKNLPKIILGLIKAVPQIIKALVEALGKGVSKFAEIGTNLIKGLWQGISDAAAWIWDKISGFFSGIVDGIKNFFGIHSPSRLFRDQIGKNLALGLGEGFADEMKKVSDEMEKAIPSDFDTQVNATVSTGISKNGVLNSNSNSNLPVFNNNISFGNVTIANDMDIKDVANKVSDYIVDDIIRRGAAYA